MQEGARPPFRSPPSVRDVRGAFPPHEIRTPPPRFPGDPGCGASLRVGADVWAIAGRRTHTRGRADASGGPAIAYEWAGGRMSVDGILKEAEARMDKSVDHLEQELQSIRTGRANPVLIERVNVPYYGTPTPLNQLAQISAPEARMLVVQVYDRGQMGTVEKAIRDAGIGLNPTNDGQVIRVPIPALTEERRREYV